MKFSPTPVINEKKYTTVYNKFKGVDFSQDASLVDKSRSHDALNLISGEGFLPEKRVGWRILRTYTGKINGIFRFNDELIVHAGTKIYKDEEEPVELFSGVSNDKSVSFYMGSKLYIKTSTGYLVYDGTTMTAVVGKTPIILISRNPSGGGTLYEGINLLSDKKTEQFLGNGTATTYQLSANNLTSIDKVEVMDSNGEWVTYTLVTSSPRSNKLYARFDNWKSNI